jgi:hypothetical protein
MRQAKNLRCHEVGIREACVKALTLKKTPRIIQGPLDPIKFIESTKRFAHSLPGASLSTVEETNS